MVGKSAAAVTQGYAASSGPPVLVYISQNPRVGSAVRTIIEALLGGRSSNIILFALSAKRRRCALAVSVVHITQSCHVAKVARPKYTTVRLINSFRATAFDDSENLRKLSRKIRIYFGHVPVAIIRMDTSLSTPVNVI